MSLVAGVDSSTQSTKVELRDAHSGRPVGLGRSPHRSTPPPRSEQDPSDWWSALADALAQVSAHLDEIEAISVAGQQHGLVVVDGDDEVIRPAKLWNDTESAGEADRLTEALGAEGWAAACGLVPVPSFTITKLAWLAGNEPANVSRVARVMLPHDWLTWRLCGEHVTDRGDASGTGWWDPTTGEYRPDLLALVGGRDEWLTTLPRVAAPTEVVGRVTSEAAAELGLRAGTPVGPGTGDNMASALGLGLAEGDVVISLGTSGTVYARSAVATADPSGAVAGFADATGQYLPLVCTLNATRVTDTVADWIGLDRGGFASAALAAAPGAGGVVLVPYFDGERTPNLPDATGVLSGLSSETSRGQLARAAHEGVVCGLLDALDSLTEAGVPRAGRLLLIGGGSHSAAYRQITADLHGQPVLVPTIDEAVATGAAVQAAAVLTGRPIDEVARSWGLGGGPLVEPAPDVDAARIRSRYRETAARVAGPS